jgi:hypothetical protein
MEDTVLGYPPKVLLHAVESAAGPEALAKVKRLAGLPEDGGYRMSVDYPPSHIDKLGRAVGEVLGKSREEVEDFFVEAFFPDIVRRWPMWFQTSKTARELLELQPEIHNSFAKASADPDVGTLVGEKFRLEKLEHETVVHYRSPHRLCRMYVQLAHRVLKHYGETAEIEERICLLRGDPECEIHLRWS